MLTAARLSHPPAGPRGEIRPGPQPRGVLLPARRRARRWHRRSYASARRPGAAATPGDAAGRDRRADRDRGAARGRARRRRRRARRAHDQERRLEILKDPRVGAFGALALIVAVGLITTTIATLDTADAVKALVISHTLSRWAILPVSIALKPARPGGSGSLLRVSMPSLIAATVIAAAIVTPLQGAPALLGAALATVATGLVLHTTLGGITGDGYGATAKLAELASATTLVALWT